MAAITVRTLGAAEIHAGSMRVTPNSVRNFALLLYLAAERGTRISRGTLHAMIFPDQSETNAGHGLRQLIYKFRQAGAVIETDKHAVWVSPEAVSLDHLELTHCDRLTPEQIVAVEGGLLPGYAPEHSEAFAEWFGAYRARTSIAVCRALLERLARTRSVGDWSTTERLARACLRIDPLNEEGHLALAEMLAISGSKTAAVKLLDEYVSEVGRTSPELRVPATVLRRRISERLPHVGYRSKLDLPFVGREKEMLMLGERLRRAKEGESQCVVLVGEPGIGKTRLAAEFSNLAVLDGAKVQRVAASPHDAHRPMAAFMDLVPLLLQMRGAAGCSPEAMTALARLTKPLTTEGNTPPLDPYESESVFYTISAAIGDLLTAITMETTLLVVVEDAHWLDPMSMQVLSEIVAERHARRLIVLLTTREVRPMRVGTRHADRILECAIGSLGDEATGLLTDAALHRSDGQADDELCAWMASASGGNPLFLATLALHYLNTGARLAVPPTLAELLERRILSVSDRARTVLQSCAVLGLQCTVTRLRAALEIPAVELVEKLCELEVMRLIVCADGGVAISHSLISDAVLQSAKASGLLLIKRRVAEVLESDVRTSQSPAQIWRCAELWVEVGEPSRALSMLRECAQCAVDIGRPSDAADMLAGALDLNIGRDERVTVARELISASEAGREFLLILRAASVLEASGAAHAHDDIELAVLHARARERPDGDALLRLLRCVECETAPIPHRARAARTLLIFAYTEDKPDIAHRAFASLRNALVIHSSNPALLEFLTVFHSAFGSLESSADAARQLLASTDGLSHAQAAGPAYNAGVSLWRAGYPGEAIRSLITAYERSCRANLRRFRLMSTGQLVTLHFDLGDDVGAREWLRTAVAFAQDYEPAAGVHAYATARIACCIHDGRLDEAVQLLGQTVGATEEGYATVHSWNRALKLRIEQESRGRLMSDDELASLLALVTRPVATVDAADLEMEVVWRDLDAKGRRNEADRMVRNYVEALRGTKSPFGRGLKEIVDGLRDSWVERDYAPREICEPAAL